MNRVPAVQVRGEVITARTRKAALAELHARSRAGRVAAAGEMRLITHGAHAGEYAIPVQAIVPPVQLAPAWHGQARAAGWVMLGAGALVASIAWLLSSLSQAALATACVTVLLVFGTWVWAKHRPARASVTVTTTTRVDIR